MHGPDDATVAAVIADNITAATIAGAAGNPPAPAPVDTPKPIGLDDGHQPDQDVFA